MSLLSSYGDGNLVIDEALSVNYSASIIQGSWGWTSLNMSGTHTRMRECHRYATKSFRYVGMTYSTAKTCVADMKVLFTRDLKTSYWDDTCAEGAWSVQDAGTMLMADIAMIHVGGDAYDVNVRVMEDDVRYQKTSTLFNEAIFYSERLRTYGSDAHGNSSETETAASQS